MDVSNEKTVKASHESFAECEFLDVRGEGVNICCRRVLYVKNGNYTELCNRQGFQCNRVCYAWQTLRHEFQDLEKEGKRELYMHTESFRLLSPEKQRKSSAADKLPFSVSLAKPGIIFLPAHRPTCSRGWRIGINEFIICCVVG